MAKQIDKKAFLTQTWFVFIFSLAIYAVIVGVVKHIPLSIKPYLEMFGNIASIPFTVKILFGLALLEFFSLITGEKTINTIYGNKDVFPKYMIIWAISESIAVYGLIASFLGNSGIYFPPFLILSLIAFFVWRPGKLKNVSDGNQPYSFE